MKHSATLLAALVSVTVAFPAAQPKPLFSFHSNAWLNLHHYARSKLQLSVLGHSGERASATVRYTSGRTVHSP